MLAVFKSYLQLKPVEDTLDEEQLLAGNTVAPSKADAATGNARGHLRVVALVGAGVGVLVVLCAAIITIGSIHRQQSSTQQPTIREVMESQKLNDIMTDNLMTIGQVEESNRDEMKHHVANTVKKMSDRIRRDFVALDKKMDSLTFTDEATESVLHAMESFSDSRVVTLAQEVSQAVNEALDTSLDRDDFKTLLVEKLQPRIAELQGLRNDFYSSYSGGQADGINRLQTVDTVIENSPLMQSFDRWSSRVGSNSTANVASQLPINAAWPHKMMQSRALEASQAEGGAKAQLWEFFQDIHQSFRDELGDLKQEWVEALSPRAIKSRLVEYVEDTKQDMADTVNVMREDMHEMFSPSALKARMHDTVSDMKQSMVDQVEDTKQDFHNALSPKKHIDNLKQGFHSRMHNMFSPRRFGQNVDSVAVEVEEEVVEADSSLMECLAQIVTGNPEETLQCSMQALSLCIDMVRSLFAPE